MRTHTFLIAAVATLVLFAAPASAEIIDMGKHTVSEVRNACGSSFQPAADGSGYGCSKACKGGTCTVACDNNNNCKGSVPAQVTGAGSRPVKGDLNSVLTNRWAHEAAPAATGAPSQGHAPGTTTAPSQSHAPAGTMGTNAPARTAPQTR